MTDLDKATREAVAALIFRLRQRDEAGGEDRPDVEPFAQEYVLALRLRGWRPTPASGGAEPGRARRRDGRRVRA